MCRTLIILVLLRFHTCLAVIYHLNESEYLRMPPLYGLDEYGRCLVPHQGTYCLVRLDLFTRENGSLINLIHEYSAYTLKHYNHTHIDRGVCVTSTCKDYVRNNDLYTSEDLVVTLERCLNESIYTEYGLQAKLTILYYCEKNGQQIEIDKWDWLVLGIFIAIFMLNVIGTLYDVIINRSSTVTKGNGYILCFSIIRNWNSLISPESEEVKAKRLSGLHGIRLTILVLMFLAHVMFVNAMGFNDNIHEYEQYYENPYYQMIFNGLVIIQIFFVLSGFLLAYNLESYCEKNHITWALALKLWIIRLLRLTPSYAVMLAFAATWLRHIGSGPLWRLFVAGSVSVDCRRYWWAHLVYINNYIRDGQYCAIHTWHIAAENQLFCVGLIAYFGTRRGGRKLVLGLLILLGIILPAVNVWMWDLDGLVLMTPETYRSMENGTFYYMHVYGHNNLVSYAVGMATGCLVYRLQKKGIHLAENKWCQFLAWMMVPYVLGVLYSGAIFYVDGWESPLALRMAFAALHRLVISLAGVFAVVAVTLRLNSFVRAFFECRVWVVPSRLSYAVYLLHLSVIQVILGLRHQLGHVSSFNMTILHLGVVIFTFMISLPFSLMVEAPIRKITGMEKTIVEQTKL